MKSHSSTPQSIKNGESKMIAGASHRHGVLEAWELTRAPSVGEEESGEKTSEVGRRSNSYLETESLCEHS